jgi:hypothetical protein
MNRPAAIYARVSSDRHGLGQSAGTWSWHAATGWVYSTSMPMFSSEDMLALYAVKYALYLIGGALYVSKELGRNPGLTRYLALPCLRTRG